jgi:ferredoxin/DMSO/TMAO reductase YedYZ heme-binding membrane subunit
MVAATVGFIALGLLWLSVLSGTTVVVGWAVAWIRHRTIEGAHRCFTLVGLTLASVHALAQLAAPGGSVTLLAEFVPFSGRSDRVGIGLGAIAWELMLAIAASVLIARRLGGSRWRALHSFAYASFTLVCAHVVIAGSDLNRPMDVLVGAGWVATMAARLATDWQERPLVRGAVERLARRANRASVDVDATKCVRFGFCEHEAPGIFRLAADGRLSYAAKVPADQIEQAMRAARVCPARAIALSRPAATAPGPPTLTDIPLIGAAPHQRKAG